MEQTNLKKNDIVTIMIEDIGSDGEGIGKYQGYPIFVKDAIIGDEAEVKIIKAKKSYAYGKLEKVLKPSSFRVEPKCAFHRQCGGCQIQAMSYEKQLEWKENKIKNNLQRIGGFSKELVDRIMEPIIGMEEPYHYRNKAQYPIGTDKDGKLIAGFYAGRTHSIVANTDCCLGSKENKVILEYILAFMERYHIPAYNEQSGKGLVRHVLIRTGFATGEIMVCLVINGKSFPKSREFAEGLQGLTLERKPEEEPEEDSSVNEKTENRQDDAGERGSKRIVSISISPNTKNTNVIMGDEVETLWGEPYIVDYIGETKFRISPLSFYQVNPVQTEKLYGLALEYAGLTGKETVWDLYCGIGTISLFLAKKAKQVYGVEIVQQAIEDAKQNARINHIENAEFFVGRAEEVLPRKYEEERIYADVIVVDPPRKGCDEACLNTMVRMQPERIVYVSCDSATLARDLKYLGENGYEVVRGRGVDQFGHSGHVESIVLLSHKSPDSIINVKVEFGDGEGKCL
ncbi:MAG: 23S rRNA (uracil(1939)-C(5))-methyltransferase RlmD [Roseburia sp.]|nr:23S rRNA (uracil(1939)-C(5))-methyltransferase RlmD [Roseburia sp.]MCM1278385.1 23S rRNA (uracil(1939)-C(5))-methyltransferase RlmD [Robinsoniella sp.]